jgi:hypothetical protein
MAMNVDANLRESSGGSDRPAAALATVAAISETRESLVARPAPPATEDRGCCPPVEQATCCAPAAKASCCGAAPAGGCGCR